MSLPKWAKNVTNNNPYREDWNNENIEESNVESEEDNFSLPSWAKSVNIKKYENMYGLPSDEPVYAAPPTTSKEIPVDIIKNQEVVKNQVVKPPLQNRGRDYVSKLNNMGRGREEIEINNPVIPKVESTEITHQNVDNRGRNYVNKPKNTGRGRYQEEPEMVRNNGRDEMNKYTTGLAGSLIKGVESTIKGGSSFLDTAGDMANKYAKGLTNLIPSLGLKTGLNMIGKYAASDNPEKVSKVLNNAIQSTNEYMKYDQMSSGGKFVSDTISAIPQMATLLIPGAGEAVFGATAAGNYADEARQNGATLEQSALKGAIGGLTEIGLQRLLGVIPGYKKLYKDAFEKGISGLPKNVLTNKAFMKQFGVNLLREGLEESLTDPITATADKLIYDKDKPLAGANGIFDWKQMGVDFLGGALLSGIIDLPPAVGQVGNIRAVNKYINEEVPKAIAFSELLPDGYESKTMAKVFSEDPDSVTLDDLIKFVDVYHNDTIVYNAMDIYSQMKAKQQYSGTFDNIVNEQWQNVRNTQQPIQNEQVQPVQSEPVAVNKLPMLGNLISNKNKTTYNPKSVKGNVEVNKNEAPQAPEKRDSEAGNAITPTQTQTPPKAPESDTQKGTTKNTEYKPGDKVNTQDYGEVTVKSIENNLVTVTNEKGNEIQIGKQAFEGMLTKKEVKGIYKVGDKLASSLLGDFEIIGDDGGTKYEIRKANGKEMKVGKLTIDLLAHLWTNEFNAATIKKQKEEEKAKEETERKQKEEQKAKEKADKKAKSEANIKDIIEAGENKAPAETTKEPKQEESTPKSTAEGVNISKLEAGNKINVPHFGELTVKIVDNTVIALTNKNNRRITISKESLQNIINGTEPTNAKFNIGDRINYTNGKEVNPGTITGLKESGEVEISLDNGGWFVSAAPRYLDITKAEGKVEGVNGEKPVDTDKTYTLEELYDNDIDLGVNLDNPVKVEDLSKYTDIEFNEIRDKFNKLYDKIDDKRREDMSPADSKEYEKKWEVLRDITQYIHRDSMRRGVLEAKSMSEDEAKNYVVDNFYSRYGDRIKDLVNKGDIGTLAKSFVREYSGYTLIGKYGYFIGQVARQTKGIFIDLDDGRNIKMTYNEFARLLIKNHGENKNLPTPENKPQTTKADTKGAEYNNTKMGKAGKAAYKKWGENEYVNADLSKPDNSYTQKWTKYFNWWYEKGLSGKQPMFNEIPDVGEFPSFLEDEIFRAGQKDAESKKLPEPTKPKQETKPEEKPESKPEKTPLDYTRYMQFAIEKFDEQYRPILHDIAIRNHEGIISAIKDNKVTKDQVAQMIRYGYAEFESVEMMELQAKVDEGLNKKPSFNSPAKGNKESYYIAQQVKELLKNKTKFTYADLTKIGNEAYNGTQAENVYSSKDLTDAMELGVNLYLLEQKDLHLSSRYTDTVKDNIDKITELLQLLPKQNKRTEEMKTYQQFSTPPTISYIASWLACVRESDVVLEPSAGIGGLAVFAQINGAEVIANELNKRRLEVLKNMGFDKYFNENAEQLNNILPLSIKPSVVIMNPPFSTAASRTGDKTDNRNIIPHITQALKRLQEGGRLVLITGRTLSDNSFSMSSFWGDIKQEYNVKANVGIDGKNYAKYGTNFDIQIIVIDKTGETPNKWVANPEPGYPHKQYETITGNVTDLKDLVDMLGGIANGRKQITNKSDMQTPTGTGGGGHGQQNTVQPPTNTVVPGTARNGDTDTQGNSGASADSNRHPGTERQPSKNNGANEGNTTTADKKQETTSSSKDTTGGNSIEVNGPGNTVNSEIKTEQKSKQEIATDNKNDLGESIFEDYTPQKLKIEGAKPHGSKLVQSAAMASVEPPDVTYTPNLPKNLITKGIISIAQLEPIVYAGQAHEQILPNGTRKGFLIGDGTGVGKGREIAGIILDNFRQGRKKAVWISKSTDLANDAIAAWTELEQNPADIIKLSKIKGDIKQKDGILFASYDTVKSNMELSGKTGIKQKDMKKPTRLQKIINWVGKDFDGVLVFDESHVMANCMPLMGGRGVVNPTLNALAGMELQKLLPKARVVYSSATSATEVSNLGYASRLGLWGEGTEFPDASDFVESVASGGIAAMELIARDMKSQGMYISRNLSYEGVGYDTLTHKLTVDQKEIYNSMAKAWEIILNNLYAAFEINGMQKNGKKKGDAMAAFRGSSQRFFNQVITSMQMPTVVADIEKNLSEGNAVVLQLVNTNEAQLDRALIKAKENEEDIDDIDLTPREQMLNYLMKSYPVQQYEDYIEIINGQPVTKSRPVVDSEGKPVLNAEAVRMRDEMVGRLASMKIPDSALDYIVNYFGVDNVAEKTGRKKRIVTINGNKKEQKFTDGMKEADVTAFQDDKKRILVFSGAGDTGRSYHADKRVKNQRKRIHYLIQAGWTATRAVQGFGRTHRSNEKQPPNYVLITTDLKGQKRFISTIARRLDQLGALTKGQRQAGSQGMFNASDNLESSLALDSLAQLYIGIDNDRTEFAPKIIFKRLGLLGAFWSEEHGLTNDPKKLRDMNKFLNNILCLDYDTQNKLFDLFQQRLDTNYEYAKEHDLLDTGLENYKADSVEKIQEHEIRKDKSGAKTDYIELLAKHKNYFEDWKKFNYPRYVRNDKSDIVGIYKNAKSGNVKLVMKTSSRTKKDGNVVDQVKLLGQIMYSTQYVDRSTFNKGNWEKLEEKDYEVEWNKSLEQQPKFTENTLHLITGALLPIWKRLPQTGYNKVIRVKTNEGETYLGRLVQSSMIDETLRKLGAERDKKDYNTKDVISKIYDSGYEAELANGWKIVRRRVAGEYRIEVKGNDFWKYRIQLSGMGLFSTTIQYETRYFIPVGDKAEEVFNKVTEYRPIINLKSPKETDSFRTPQSVLSTTNTQANTTPNNITDIKGRREIIGEIEKELGIPFRTGRVRGKNVLGTFSRRQHVIREKFADDLDIAAHETGHYLDKLFGMREELVGKKEILRELEGLGAEQSNDTTVQRTEGIAEFVRFYITVREEAQEQAPKFFQYFESKIAKDIQVTKALDRFMENYQKYFAADPEARLLSNISINEHEIKKPIFSKSYTQWIDELNPIQKFVKDITGGETISIKIDSFKQAWLSRGWQAKAMQCIRYGVYDKSGNKACEGLEEILKPIDNMDDFRKYIISRRALELMERGIKTGLLVTDVKHSIEKYDKKYSEIFNKLQEYQDAILQKLIDSGVLSKQQKSDMQELNQDYVPFYRVFENTKKKNYAGEGFANLQTPIKKIKGSTRRIVDPIESIVKNTYYYVNIAERNNVGRSIVELADKYEGSGKYVEKVSPNMKATSFEINDVKKKLEDYGADLTKVNLENILTIFRPIMSPSAKENIVTVYKNGNKHLYQLDPELYRATLFLDNESSSALVRFLNKPTSLLRAGAILDPNFVTRNPVRDMFSALVYSNYGFVPIVDTVKGMFHVLKKDDMYQKWVSSGGGSSALVSLDRNYLQKSMREMMSQGKPGKVLSNFLKNPIEVLRAISEVMEESTRVGEFSKGVEQDGSIEGLLNAALSSRDITIDFARFGTSGKTANKVVAFFNSTIQGPDKMIREFKKNPGRFMWRSFLYVTLPSLIAWLLWHDDDRIKELPAWRKDLFWNIPTKNKIISIPKPFELGILFGSLPERVLDFIEDEEPEGLGDWAKSFLQNLTPNVFPTAILPIFEVISNHSFFRKGKIANDNLPSELQYTLTTSDMAKKIAKLPTLMGKKSLSPAKVDYFIKGYTAGLGSLGLQIADHFTSDKKINIKDVTQLPGLKGFFSEPYQSSQTVDKFYNKLNELEDKNTVAVREYKTDNNMTNSEYQSFSKKKANLNYTDYASDKEYFRPDGMSLAEYRDLRKYRAIKSQLDDIKEQENLLLNSKKDYSTKDIYKKIYEAQRIQLIKRAFGKDTETISDRIEYLRNKLYK